jgi:hypothetical protein
VQDQATLGRALGNVEYEMYVLATALLTRAKWRVHGYKRPLHPEHEAAAELALLKTRSLFEFLTGVRKKRKKKATQHEQLTLQDFGLSLEDWPSMGQIYSRLSQYSAHLTLDRAREELPSWPERFELAEAVLRRAAQRCRDIYAENVRLSARHHKARHPLVVKQLIALGIDYA